jgi:dTDP-4-dehydrorhamnose 3,5-epimerase
MNLTPLGIDGAWLAESPIWNDERGFFREWFRLTDVQAKTGIDFSIQQANISQSKRGVIRGIHYSLAPKGQAKWVTCAEGSIQDVIVDLRQTSKTFCKSISIKLESQKGLSVLLAPGLGHGFLSLEERTTVSYLLSTEYVPSLEYGVNPLDENLNIDWETDGIQVNLSLKDELSPSLESLKLSKLLPK